MIRKIFILFVLISARYQYAQVNQATPIKSKSVYVRPQLGVNSNKSLPPSTSAVIGTSTLTMQTLYDLQSNGAMGRRIAIDTLTGYLATVCTISPPPYNSTYPYRGTGYNNSTNCSGTWGALPMNRLEEPSTANISNGIRTGFPCIDFSRNNEIIVNHAGTNNLILWKRPLGSNGLFDTVKAALRSPSPDNSFWPKIATSGDTVHIVSVINSTSNKFMGVIGPLTYLRSTDGGSTFNPGNIVGSNHSIISGIDSNYFCHISGDSYAIAAKGNIVVVVVANFWNGIRMAKSFDAGLTWPVSVWVDSLSRRKYDPAFGFNGNGISDFDLPPDGIADTIYSNDENVDVTLDDNGMAHVFYGISRIIDDSAATFYPNYSYFPLQDGLAYWNENMPSATSGKTLTGKNIIASVEDLNGDGIIGVPSYSFGYYFGMRNFNLTSQPSAFAKNGRIYLTYTSMVEGSASLLGNGDSALYRHVYIKQSKDNGLTWERANDLNPNGDFYDCRTKQDCIFPSIAKGICGGKIHITYLMDTIPGSNSYSFANNYQSDWVYEAVDTADLNTSNLTNLVVDSSCFRFANFSNGIIEHGNIKSLKVFPNPSIDNLNIRLELKEETEINLIIYNSLGEVVVRKNAKANYGMNTISINTKELKSGLYFIETKSKSSSMTTKFVVQD